MNKLLFVSIFILLSIGDCLGQTYYYKLTKKIEGTDVYTNTGGGQFVTFSGNNCFESTKEGTSVGNGVLELNRVVNGNFIYRGTCYFGNNSEFKFSEDKSVLNISPGNGIIYVYHKSQPAKDITTCTLIRKAKTSSPSNNNTTDYPYSYNQYSNSCGDINIQTTTSNDQDKKRWESFYRETYARWERTVQSTYNSIVDRINRSGNGSTSHDKYGAWTSSMLNEYHNQQAELRKVRQEAQTKGVHISPSNWESASISIY